MRAMHLPGTQNNPVSNLSQMPISCYQRITNRQSILPDPDTHRQMCILSGYDAEYQALVSTVTNCTLFLAPYHDSFQTRIDLVLYNAGKTMSLQYRLQPGKVLQTKGVSNVLPYLLVHASADPN